jgi:hypothetical protein
MSAVRQLRSELRPATQRQLELARKRRDRRLKREARRAARRAERQAPGSAEEDRDALRARYRVLLRTGDLGRRTAMRAIAFEFGLTVEEVERRVRRDRKMVEL